MTKPGRPSRWSDVRPKHNRAGGHSRLRDVAEERPQVDAPAADRRRGALPSAHSDNVDSNLLHSLRRTAPTLV